MSWPHKDTPCWQVYALCAFVVAAVVIPLLIQH